jgi:hypothetical protein
MDPIRNSTCSTYALHELNLWRKSKPDCDYRATNIPRKLLEGPVRTHVVAGNLEKLCAYVIDSGCRGPARSLYPQVPACM